jgi:hypothetical protein
VFPEPVEAPRTSTGGLGGGGPGRTLASLEDDAPMMRSASREGRNERVVHPGGAGGPWLERQHTGRQHRAGGVSLRRQENVREWWAGVCAQSGACVDGVARRPWDEHGGWVRGFGTVGLLGGLPCVVAQQCGRGEIGAVHRGGVGGLQRRLIRGAICASRWCRRKGATRGVWFKVGWQATERCVEWKRGDKLGAAAGAGHRWSPPWGQPELGGAGEQPGSTAPVTAAALLAEFSGRRTDTGRTKSRPVGNAHPLSAKARAETDNLQIKWARRAAQHAYQLILRALQSPITACARQKQQHIVEPLGGRTEAEPGTRCAQSGARESFFYGATPF